MVSSRYLNSSIRITNIKLSCSINSKFNKDFSSFNHNRYIISKQTSSFFVIRCLKYTFVLIIFYKGHINITGIRHWKDIGCAYTIASYFAKLIHGKVVRRCIDNISASYYLHKSCKQLLLPQFCQYLENEKYYTSVRYNLDKFAGAFFKSKHGTIVLFSTYSCYTVGAKTIHALNTLYKHLVIQLLNFHLNV